MTNFLMAPNIQGGEDSNMTGDSAWAAGANYDTDAPMMSIISGQAVGALLQDEAMARQQSPARPGRPLARQPRPPTAGMTSPPLPEVHRFSTIPATSPPGAGNSRGFAPLQPPGGLHHFVTPTASGGSNRGFAPLPQPGGFQPPLPNHAPENARVLAAIAAASGRGVHRHPAALTGAVSEGPESAPSSAPPSNPASNPASNPSSAPPSPRLSRTPATPATPANEDELRSVAERAARSPMETLTQISWVQTTARRVFQNTNDPLTRTLAENAYERAISRGTALVNDPQSNFRHEEAEAPPSYRSLPSAQDIGQLPVGSDYLNEMAAQQVNAVFSSASPPQDLLEAAIRLDVRRLRAANPDQSLDEALQLAQQRAVNATRWNVELSTRAQHIHQTIAAELRSSEPAPD